MKATHNIKWLAWLIIFVGTTVVSYSQTKKLRYSENLEAFAGVWEYKTGSEVFRVVLVKGSLNTKFSYGDYLIGGYYYSKNGAVVYDCSQHIPTAYTDASNDFYTGPAISGSNGSVYSQQTTPNKADLLLNDYLYDKLGRVFFTLLSPTTARFELREVWGKDPDWPEGFSIPTNVGMTKVGPPPPPSHTMPDVPEPPQPDL